MEIAQVGLEFLVDRINSHQLAGDFDEWIQHKLTADLSDLIAGPVGSALADVGGAIESSVAARASASQAPIAA